MTDTNSFVHLLLVLAAVLLTTRALSVLAEKFGQPAILGELLGGIVLGASVLGILDPNDLAIHTLAQLGLLILLFEIGLETDLRALTSGRDRDRDRCGWRSNASVHAPRCPRWVSAASPP